MPWRCPTRHAPALNTDPVAKLLLLLAALFGSRRSAFGLLLALLDHFGLGRSCSSSFFHRSRSSHFLDMSDVRHGRFFVGDEMKFATMRQVLYAQHLAEGQ